jgi:hypothetical protein
MSVLTAPTGGPIELRSVLPFVLLARTLRRGDEAVLTPPVRW